MADEEKNVVGYLTPQCLGFGSCRTPRSASRPVERVFDARKITLGRCAPRLHARFTLWRTCIRCHGRQGLAVKRPVYAAAALACWTTLALGRACIAYGGRSSVPRSRFSIVESLVNKAGSLRTCHRVRLGIIRKVRCKVAWFNIGNTP